MTNPIFLSPPSHASYVTPLSPPPDVCLIRVQTLCISVYVCVCVVGGVCFIYQINKYKLFTELIHFSYSHDAALHVFFYDAGSSIQKGGCTDSHEHV